MSGASMADFFATMDISAVSGVGILVLVLFLLVFDRLITRGSMTRQLAALKDFYEKRIAALTESFNGRLTDKDERYADMKEAWTSEKTRADRLEEQVVRGLEVAEGATHVLAELDKAAKESSNG